MAAVALAVVFAVGSGTPALAADAGANPPTPQTLAALKAQADAVQAELTAGAATLDAARSKLAALQAAASAATAEATRINERVNGMRDELSGYEAQLYMDPDTQTDLTALTGGGNLAVAVQGVQMLSIINSGRTEVLRAVVVDEQQAEVLQTQAAQAATEVSSRARQRSPKAVAEAGGRGRGAASLTWIRGALGAAPAT